MSDPLLRSRLIALVAHCREKEQQLRYRADGQAKTPYAHCAAAEAEGVVWAAGKLEAVLASLEADPECPVCGVKASEAADVAAACGTSHEPTPEELAQVPGMMRRIGERLIQRANEDEQKAADADPAETPDPPNCWLCGCGAWSGLNLAQCGVCARPRSESDISWQRAARLAPGRKD